MKNNFTLRELIDVLHRAFDHILPEQCSDIVITFGNTGCGKSTLLGAMIIGSDKLEAKVV